MAPSKSPRGRLAKLLAKFLGLEAGERWAAVQLTHSVALTQLLIRVLPLPRVLALLDGPLTWPAGLGMASARRDPRRLVRLSKALLRQDVAFLRKNCLRQCLALYPILRRAGHPIVFRLGVARDADGFRAHSWLEFEGRPLAEDGDPTLQFKVIYSHPDPQSPPPDANLWRSLT